MPHTHIVPRLIRNEISPEQEGREGRMEGCVKRGTGEGKRREKWKRKEGEWTSIYTGHKGYY